MERDGSAAQRGWKSRSGKKRLNSIRIPAVMVNQIAENTGAVVRNFFIVRGRWMGRMEQLNQRGETVILSSASVSFLPVNSPKAARGQLAAARVLLKARGTSIWISRMVASLLPRIAIR
jgi:hypothetical protein